MVVLVSLSVSSEKMSQGFMLVCCCCICCSHSAWFLSSLSIKDVLLLCCCTRCAAALASSASFSYLLLPLAFLWSSDNSGLFLFSIVAVFTTQCFSCDSGLVLLSPGSPGSPDLQGVQMGPSSMVTKVAWQYSTVILRRIYVESQWCGDNLTAFYEIRK